MADATIQPIQKAAQRKVKKFKRPGITPGFGDQPGSTVSKPLKGKYIGKERYKGLTKGTPKGKYKGKYIGPDRFKGDAAAYQKYKDEKAAKKGLPLKKKSPKKGTPNYDAWLKNSQKARSEGKAYVDGWKSDGPTRTIN